MTKTALITGASSGIGADLARIHAAGGGDVSALATNADGLAARKGEMDVIAGLPWARRLQFSLVRSMPKRMGLDQVFATQQAST